MINANSQLIDATPPLGIPETPIHAGNMRVYIACDLRKAADILVVNAKTLITATDADNKTLWKLEEAFRVLANIIDRLDSADPVITAAERNLGHVQSE